ncbi:unnamed protein product [Ixodes pacificus]
MAPSAGKQTIIIDERHFRIPLCDRESAASLRKCFPRFILSREYFSEEEWTITPVYMKSRMTNIKENCDVLLQTDSNWQACAV